MRLSQEADYAVRSVLHLAEHGGEVQLIDEIAAAMAIPRSFAAKILQKLVGAGLVQSRRGVGGGFVLALPPEQVTLLAVVEAIEGKLALNKCVHEGRTCQLKASCAVHPVWCELTALTQTYLSSVDLQSLLDRSQLPQVTVAPIVPRKARLKVVRRKSHG
jgi:Rrf2 family protein